MNQQIISPTSLSQFLFEDPRQLHGTNRATYDTRRAVYELLSSSRWSAVLVAKEWRVVQEHYRFEYMDIYEKVASESGCFVAKLTRESEGGQEHLLFITLDADLSTSNLLSCLGDSNRKPVGAHSRWA